MCFFKGRLGVVMAGQTKRRLDFNKKVLDVRAVGPVTGRAAFCLFDFMNNLFLVILLFVTQITGLIAFCFHQVASLRSMGIMAEDAFASIYRCMNVGLIQSQFFSTVAGETDLVSFLLEQELRNHTMPQVAVLALSLLDHGVDILHAHVFVHKFLVAVKTFPSGKPRLPLRCRRGSQGSLLWSLRAGIQ